MHIIQSVEIQGLRGRTKPITLNLDPHVNFLIGRNGSGKTTVINLINSTLAVDPAGLLATPFTSIKIKLRRRGSNRRPTIEVRRTESDLAEPPSVEYLIRTQAGKPSERFTVYADERYTRARWQYVTRDGRRINRYVDPVGNAKETLDDLVSTTWLSVHRATSARTRDSDDRFDFPVDKRLAQVARDFGTYFSVLDKRAAEETNSFQQTYFLSLVSPPNQNR